MNNENRRYFNIMWMRKYVNKHKLNYIILFNEKRVIMNTI